MHYVPRNIFGLLGGKFDVVICADALKGRPTPVVEESVNYFWTPVSIFIDPVLLCHGKGSFAFTGQFNFIHECLP